MHQSELQGEGQKLIDQKAAGVVHKAKRKLPPPVFGTPQESKVTPQNDPSLHQGRKRSKPHVDGDWPTHIYISINFPPKINSLLKQVVDKLSQDDSLNHCWHSSLELIESSKDGSGGSGLHLSMTQPIFLKTNERHEFLNQLTKNIRGIKEFEIYFATFSTFLNDDCSRGFLALEVGSGHSMLKRLLDRIDQVLESFFQPKYYDNPRFHVSIGWCLVEEQSPSSQKVSNNTNLLIPDLVLQNLNNHEQSCLDLIRKTCCKINSLNLVIGKTHHQVLFDSS